MALFNKNVPSYKPTKDVAFDWQTFRKGLNTLLMENELNEEELSQASNIILTGKGIPTKRWGTALYYQAGNATGSTRGLAGFYKSNGTIDLVAITDDGFLTIRSNASYTRVNGVSFASGSDVFMSQLDDSLYIVNGQRELAKYSNPTLVGFPTIAVPVMISATNLSNATGSSRKSYKVSAISQVGETLASVAIELGTQPVLLGGTAGGTIRLTWTGVSTASAILQGFNIYGRDIGEERFLVSTDAATTFFDDNGLAIPKDFTYPPTSDSTGGPKTKYITRFQDRLIFAGISGEPSKVLISGRVPNQEKFDLSFGGNYIEIEPDAGDNIVQIIGFSDRIIVLKERSIWQITLTTEQVGNFFITTPQLKLVTSSNGCISPKSVVAVENDVFFLSRRGVFSLGYQENFAIDALRTGEVSVRVRPYFKNLTTAQKETAVAIYHDGKYLIAFPGKDQMMVFDRERAAWTGPWNLDATVFETFYDGSNNSHLLFAQEGSVLVDEFSETFTDDKGVAITTTLRTKKEDFGQWALFKNIRNIFTEMSDVTGTISVEILIETRSGQVNTAKSFNITPASGNSGWGADQWGAAQWGDSEEKSGGVDALITIRWANLNKIGRTFQMVFTTSAKDANYKLLGIKGDAKPLSKGFNPSTWRI